MSNGWADPPYSANVEGVDDRNHGCRNLEKALEFPPLERIEFALTVCATLELARRVTTQEASPQYREVCGKHRDKGTRKKESSTDFEPPERSFLSWWNGKGFARV